MYSLVNQNRSYPQNWLVTSLNSNAFLYYVPQIILSELTTYVLIICQKVTITKLDMGIEIYCYSKMLAECWYSGRISILS